MGVSRPAVAVRRTRSAVLAGTSGMLRHRSLRRVRDLAKLVRNRLPA